MIGIPILYVDRLTVITLAGYVYLIVDDTYFIKA